MVSAALRGLIRGRNAVGVRGGYYQGNEIRYASESRSVLNLLFIRFGTLTLEPFFVSG